MLEARLFQWLLDHGVSLQTVLAIFGLASAVAGTFIGLLLKEWWLERRKSLIYWSLLRFWRVPIAVWCVARDARTNGEALSIYVMVLGPHTEYWDAQNDLCFNPDCNWKKFVERQSQNTDEALDTRR